MIWLHKNTIGTMIVEALVPICILMEAMGTLLWRSNDLVTDVLGTLGANAPARFGWSVNGQHWCRRDIVPASRGDTVALKDQFWINLETKHAGMQQLLRWWAVPTQVPGSGEFESLSGLLSMMYTLMGSEKNTPVGGYIGLTHAVNCAMGSLVELSNRALSPGGVDADRLRATVLLVIDVFDQVYELCRRVVPLIKDELLEVVGGPVGGEFYVMNYRLKEGSEASDKRLAEAMGEVMLEDIQGIVMFVQGQVTGLVG